ncbi:lytic murein transglycosylase [Metapseudomonas resinovorans]|uniref:Putative membrane-bound lytic murein transglycosylase n=1 Tax=Metapseudomonas resinovorans NBRC 106553 TaxID=1245471 RepID=S6ACM0_METRE|nr:lytic murein transglycosylase [Pseudomonas resinovorans]BAN46537.1 putative membrane-bound lytic murein transglycosylase [Pseudomonas resinovorans NBRC 106553]
MFDAPASGLILRSLAVASALTLLNSCSGAPTEAIATAPLPQSAPAGKPVAKPTPAVEPSLEMPSISFDAWRDDFRRTALAQGITAATFDRAFADVTPDPKVIAADRSQPEFTRPVWEYLEGAISPYRVRKGQSLLEQNSATLDAIEQRFGVDRAPLVAIWGMESSFGQFMGDMSVIRSLATLAYEGRRPEFAQAQLLAALEILQHGDVQPYGMLGSWAGAMGQTQFIPTTYNSHAVDFDGDGRRDIWKSSADALASAAHYLQASGWRKGQPAALQVQLPAGFDYAHADGDIRKSVAQWQAMGVQVGAQGAALGGDSASLLLPAGHRGPAFLVLDNFRAILKYNNSSSYALAVSLLAERFNGGGELIGSWPRDELPLSRSERVELQESLAAAGFDPGAADGIIGANTRKAIRGYQQRLGWPADGFPTQKLLGQLREGR